MTFRQLASTSAARGGMEKTVTFTYDENVATVMAAFRERTQTPHASMPVVHRVDILEERLVANSSSSSSSSSPDRSPGGWSHRVRRFYAANDAPDWIRRITGGDYLTGTERIEWSETLGRMVMYTANESHAHLVAAVQNELRARATAEAAPLWRTDNRGFYEAEEEGPPPHIAPGAYAAYLQAVR